MDKVKETMTLDKFNKNRDSVTSKNSAFKNIILISLDCVRMESLSCYKRNFGGFIYKHLIKPRTPNIDRIANDGVKFTHAICQAPYTPASHASILTGVNPPIHGIQTMVGNKLSESTQTLAGKLKEYDYKTGAFIGSFAMSKEYGLNRGFDIYDQDFDVWIRGTITREQRFGEESTNKALKWMTDTKNDKFFLFIHYFDAHGIPLKTFLDYPIEIGGRHRILQIKQVRKKYIQIVRILKFFEQCILKFILGKGSRHKIFQIKQVKKIDKQIGRILDFLEKNNLYENTIIVLIADHGDAFGEHGENNHRSFLYDTTIRIPLIIKGPAGLKGVTIPNQVRSIDIVPTILELLEIPLQGNYNFNSVEGESLLKIMEGNTREDRLAYIETCEEVSRKNWLHFKRHYVGLRTGNWKLIIDKLNGTKQLYDLKNDPNEIHNLVNQQEEIARELEKKLNDITKMQDKNKIRKTSQTDHEIENIKERLKKLGYL